MKNEIKVESKEGVLIVLEGKAQEPINPKRQYFLGGNIRAVVEYVEGRQRAGVPVDPKTSIVVIDESELSITLTTDFHLHEQGGVTVEAKLAHNQRLIDFGINSNKRFSVKELEKLFSFNADMFSSDPHANKHGMIVASLRSFNAKVQLEIQEGGDKRGNKAQNFTKQVQTDIAESIVMVANIFKGTEHKTFSVDICYEVTDGGARFWLESTELHQLTIHEVNSQFKIQKTYLSDVDENTSKHGLTVISK
jgi:hypothetical protein